MTPQERAALAGIVKRLAEIERISMAVTGAGTQADRLDDIFQEARAALSLAEALPEEK